MKVLFFFAVMWFSFSSYAGEFVSFKAALQVVQCKDSNGSPTDCAISQLPYETITVEINPQSMYGEAAIETEKAGVSFKMLVTVGSSQFWRYNFTGSLISEGMDHYSAVYLGRFSTNNIDTLNDNEVLWSGNWIHLKNGEHLLPRYAISR